MSSITAAISFTPREEGEHLVNVKKLGKHLAGSPFKINVLVKDIGNASKVKITGNGITEGKTHAENQFVLHTSDAGKAISTALIIYSRLTN